MNAPGRRRGFTLTEVVVVLVLLGALLTLFVASRGSTGAHAATLQAQAATSQAADAIISAHTQARTAPAPQCDDVTDTSLNTHAFSSPCALVDLGPGPRYLPATRPSLDPSAVSIAERATADGWQVVLVSAAGADRDQGPATCQVLVRPVPGGTETYYQYPMSETGCAAGAALSVLEEHAGDCTPPRGTSWRRTCALPTPS